MDVDIPINVLIKARLFIEKNKFVSVNNKENLCRMIRI